MIRLRGGMGGFRKRPQSMGVKVKDRMTDSTTEADRVSANSRISRPTTPLMNIRGVKTAIREMAMDRMVKLISPAPFSAAWNGFSPCSILRQMASTMTMASSTTKPTAMVRAIRDRLSRLNPAGSITAAVASSDNGITALGMMVARTLRRNRKITPTTSTMVISKVISTSLTEALMVWVRSCTMCMSMLAGILAWMAGRAFLIVSTVRRTLAPGCFVIASRMVGPDGRPTSRLARPGKLCAPVWLFSTSWMAWPISFTRTGAPFL